jgi:hypothetical protein
MSLDLKLLAPGAHSKKAIYGAAVGFFTALTSAAKSGGISFPESCGIVAATVLGYLAVWAGKNVDKDTEGEAGKSNGGLAGGLGDAGHSRGDLLVVLTFIGVVILIAALLF